MQWKKTNPASGEPDGAQPAQDGRMQRLLAALRAKRRWLIPAAVVAAAAIVFLVRRAGAPAQSVSGPVDYIEEEVLTRTISDSLTGSGTLKPANSYTVTPLVAGEILAAGFEEGDVVEKGAVLYQIDSANAQTNIEKSQIALAQAQRSYEKTVEMQYARAGINGIVYSLNVSAGDLVAQGQEVAVVRDNSVLTLKVPFPAQDAAGFSVGQAATVTLDGTFEVLPGVVTAVSGIDLLGAGNILVRNVTIQVANPGSMNIAQAATANVAGIDCTESAVFSYRAETTIKAPATGTVQAVYVQEGSAVGEKDVLFTLGGDELDELLLNAAEALRSAELSMENTQEQLDSYTITSPINGTIVEKTYKAGDAVEAGKSMCVIYDLSYLEMTINVDELDINSVAVGQPVTITADAVSDRVYTGVITRVSVAGTASGNNNSYSDSLTSSYPVTVRIDETEGLRPGMNVNAEIVVAQAEDVLSVPNAAVQRGNLVLVTKASPSAAQAAPDLEAPDGYVYVEVTPGFSDDNYIEIIEGLQPGDVVAYTPQLYGGYGMYAMAGAIRAVHGAA